MNIDGNRGRNNNYRGKKRGGRGGRNRGGSRGGRNNNRGGYKGHNNNNKGGSKYTLNPVDNMGNLSNNNNFNLSKLTDIDAHQNQLNSISWWDFEGIKLFTGSEDASWKLWDSNNNFSNISTQDMGGAVTSLQIMGSFLFVGFESAIGACQEIPNVSVGMVRAWNLENTSIPPYEFTVSPNQPYAHAGRVDKILALDVNGSVVVISGGLEGLIRVWSWNNNGFNLVHTLEGHVRGITDIVMGDVCLWTSSLDMTLRLWDINTGQCGQILSSNNGGHTGDIKSLLPYKYGDKSFMISAGLDKLICVWDQQSAQLEFSHQHIAPISAMCMAKDTNGEQLLIVGSSSGYIDILDLPSFKIKAKIDPHTSGGHQTTITSLSIGPATTFFSGDQNGRLSVWEIK